jgi:hypothetical protein
MALVGMLDIRVKIFISEKFFFCFNLLFRFLEAREQNRSNLGNCLLINKLKSFIDSVSANNSSLASMEKHSTHARLCTFSTVIFREEFV